MDQETLNQVSAGGDGERNTGEEESARYLQDVAVIEKMYEKKAAKAIKQQLQTENDPVSQLRPHKSNIDLKRSLDVKLAQLNVKTDRAILEILSKSLSHSSNITFRAKQDSAMTPAPQDNSTYSSSS